MRCWPGATMATAKDAPAKRIEGTSRHVRGEERRQLARLGELRP